MRFESWTLLVLCLAVASGCVYPRRSTSLSPVSAERSSGTIGAPAEIWTLTVVGANVRPRKSGGLAWDESGGLPDVYARIIRDGRLIFETETIDDSLTPEWNATLPRNVRIDARTPLRIEVWDRDLVGSDPVGIYDRRGLPQMAVEGADARIMLEGGSWLTIRRSAPRPHRGVGIGQYELRPDQLYVVEVLPHSPAARAGIEPGDAIVAIGERRVADMSDGEAATALSMAVSRNQPLTVRRGEGAEREVELDRGFVWLTM